MSHSALLGIGAVIAVFAGSTVMAADSSWQVLAEVGEFAATPDKIRAEQRPRVVDRMSGQDAEAGGAKATTAYAATGTGRQRMFRVLGRVPDIRAMRWESPLSPRDIGATPYYVIRYKAKGQRRDHHPMPVIAVSGVDAKNEPASLPLLDCSEVINDGLWHVVVGRHDSQMTVRAVEVQLGTVDSEATLELAVCTFHSGLPHVAAGFAHEPAKAADGEFRSLDLGALFNDEYAAAADRVLKAHGKFVDGGSLFSAERIAVGGVPFTLKTAGKNIVAPPSDPKANTGTVNVLGTELAKRNYHRMARQDKIEVPVGGKAGEICFILVTEMAPTIGRYALPKIPLRLHNIDTFAVEIVYAQGDSDFAFPYSIADRGHSLQRMTGAYAVPADPAREIEAVVFENRYYGASFNLAAVTLNAGPAKILTQELRAPPAYRAGVTIGPSKGPAKITKAGKSCTIQNGNYLIELDWSAGFSIKRLAHRWSPDTEIALDPTSGLEVVVGDKILTGRSFEVRKAGVTNEGLGIVLGSTDAAVPLGVSLFVTCDASSQIKFRARVHAEADKPTGATIRFPVLKGLAIGDLADTWIYFPQCRNVCTSQPGTYLAPNDRPFPMQFFDVFNPKAGIGIAVLTHNLDRDVLDYCVRKDDSGVTAFVQYPAEYHAIEPGKMVELTETCLVFHGGDWHGALEAYQDWVKTWYKPVKSDGLDWWHKSFALRAHLAGRAYSWAVPIFDAEKNQFRVKELLEQDRGYLGLEPDVVHLGGWVDFNKMHAGDFNGGDYAVEDYTGGPDVLRAAVREMRKDGVRASVYTIPDRCAKVSRIGQQLGPKIAQMKADGSPSQDEKCWYVCLGAKQWQDHYVEALKRTQRELGLDAVYVDVFGYTRGYTCHSKEHGHETPLNVHVACDQLIRRLRAELPEGVAIWSEFLLPDVSSQFTSGNITYYFLTLHEYMVKSYDQSGRAPLFTPMAQSVHRFAFPHVKQFGFPVGFEGGPSSHELRFLFFNGEGLYDVGWLLYDGRDLARVRNWLAIQKQYADCFASTRPKPLVPTEAGEVYANEFPGDGRTAWTIFNARFATFRGTVLAIEHGDGDTYHDAWNHRELGPRIVDGKAVIELNLDPQGLGCVVRTRGKGR